MEALYLIVFFILGTLMSSFFCVVGLRLPRGENFVKGKSACDSCQHPLALYEMIPLISYLLQKGRCRYCGEKIAPIIPLSELIGGLLYAISYYIFGISIDLLIAIGVASLFVIIFVTDTTYYIIPDTVLFFFGIYFFILEFLKQGLTGILSHITSAIILFTIMYLMMLLGEKLFKRESLGGGDVKLLFLFGLVLESIPGFLTIFLASLIALPSSLILLYKEKTNMIPFGPFLLLGFAIVFYNQITTAKIIEFFF